MIFSKRHINFRLTVSQVQCWRKVNSCHVMNFNKRFPSYMRSTQPVYIDHLLVWTIFWWLFLGGNYTQFISVETRDSRELIFRLVHVWLLRILRTRLNKVKQRNWVPLHQVFTVFTVPVSEVHYYCVRFQCWYLSRSKKNFEKAEYTFYRYHCQNGCSRWWSQLAVLPVINESVYFSFTMHF